MPEPAVEEGDVARVGPVTASVRDTAGILAGVVAPIVARGVIIRRPRVVALAERLDLDRRAVRRLQRLRDRYGPGPLLLRIPIRRQAVVLAPEHVGRVLEGTPDPFSAASSEKRAALAHFEPRGVLVSTGAERAERRRFNEAVLETDRPVHHLADRFVPVAREEHHPLAARLDGGGVVAWPDFVEAWFAMARRVVLGDDARDDTALTDDLAALRSDANWAFMRPKRTELRDRFLSRLADRLATAQPGSLAAVMAGTPTGSPATAPVEQVPQWLFAFDAAALATFRALALLATHPAQAAVARDEVAEATDGVPTLPHLRACLLESLRLWPTTPAVLRQTTAPTSWDGGTLPAGTGLLIHAPFFHRDPTRLADADRFAPELWSDGRAVADWPLIPFSAGPAMCPGRQLVLLLGSTVLATMVDGRALALDGRRDRLGPDRPLPGTLDPFSLRFRAAAVAPAGDRG